jgi:molybdopterin-binding protein
MPDFLNRELLPILGLLRLHEATQLVGVSYPMLKQWIYNGKIKSVKTAGGHHRIPKSEIERLNGADKRKARKKPVGLGAISGRHKLFGKITKMRYDGLLAQVSIEVGGQTTTSIITSGPASDLDLKKGGAVYALVKATEAMAIRG